MPLKLFYDAFTNQQDWTKREHNSYKESILAPVAPEYTTGEVLLGAAYRELLLEKSESSVDLEEINKLSSRLSPKDTWEIILGSHEGLASPGLSRGLPLPQLMPFVPEIARYACVLGRKSNRRWAPGNLLISTTSSGLCGQDVEATLQELSRLLTVDDDEDILAQFVEEALKPFAGPVQTSLFPDTFQRSIRKFRPAWRPVNSSICTPSERFCKDIRCLAGLKGILMRRQWTVFVEALLRIGLGTHVLWLCRLNASIWTMAQETIASGKRWDVSEVDSYCWGGHYQEPLLELGRDSVPLIRKWTQEYIKSRIGFSIILHCLEDINAQWKTGIGVPMNASDTSPIGAVVEFLSHLADNAQGIRSAVRTVSPQIQSLVDLTARLADSRPALLASKAGITKNLFEFTRYALGQLQTRSSEMSSYDQAYLLYPRPKKKPKFWFVQPGPTALLLLVHACAQASPGLPVSIDDFRHFLFEYGIHVPSGELQEGQTSRDLERLGLVVDSPDAGGGRLMVDPF